MVDVTTQKNEEGCAFFLTPSAVSSWTCVTDSLMADGKFRAEEHALTSPTSSSLEGLLSTCNQTSVRLDEERFMFASQN